MGNTDTIKRAYRCNLIIVGLVLFAVAWMFSGINFGNVDMSLNGSKWEIFKFYTTDSNILMGLVALMTALKERQIINGKRTELDVAVYVLKLLGTVGVTLTMTVASFFLAPSFENGWIVCFSNSAGFLHLIIPLLSVYTFIRYECTSCIRWRHTFTGIITMLIYASIYLVNCLTHVQDGAIPFKYDWYGFFIMGTKSVYVVLPIILLTTYLISLGLWFFNRLGVKMDNQGAE